jgi:hypothetical protein
MWRSVSPCPEGARVAVALVPLADDVRAGPRGGGVDARAQGLTFVHFWAQRKRFAWDRGRMQGLF